MKTLGIKTYGEGSAQKTSHVILYAYGKEDMEKKIEKTIEYWKEKRKMELEREPVLERTGGYVTRCGVIRLQYECRLMFNSIN